MRLSRINTFLLVAIILINGYVIALPVMPGVLFWWQNRDGKQTSQLEKKIEALASTANNSDSDKRPTDNRLIIPSMAFDQPILEGKTARTLNSGLWRKPSSSTPLKGDNTVLIGHRLTYTNPRGTLYHLDKVKNGDQIGVWWEGKMHSYTVTEVKVVKATEIAIEQASEDDRLTIYTCTPLWLPKDRLVVIAKPEKTDQ